MTVDQATHAAQCCPVSALRQLSPADLAALDRWCGRAMADPDAEPRHGDEAAAVARYEALLAERAREWWRASPVPGSAAAPQRALQPQYGASW